MYRPARVVSYDLDSGELILHNYMDFDDLKDYVEISYEVTQDGLMISKGKLPAFSVAPHQEGKTKLELSIPGNGKVYLKLIYRLKKSAALLEKNHVLGFDEIQLSGSHLKTRQAEQWLNRIAEGTEIRVKEKDTQIEIKAADFVYIIDKRTALFEQIQFAGRNYLKRPMELNIWRAPTDNDMYMKEVWKKAHYHEAYTRAYDIEVCQNRNGVEILAYSAIVAATVQKIMDVKIKWIVDASGKVSSEFTVLKDGEFPELPRFGLRLFLDKSMENACYYGMGPQESYRDKHRAASHGLYRSKVCDLHEDYIRPQENGSHYDCDYLELSGSQYGIAAVAKKSFSFNASHYTQEELERAAHNYELCAADSTILCLDYALNGIGSNSCGPVVLEKYRFDETEFQFGLTLVPFVKGTK